MRFPAADTFSLRIPLNAHVHQILHHESIATKHFYTSSSLKLFIDTRYTSSMAAD